jgi:hypothetical protein
LAVPDTAGVLDELALADVEVEVELDELLLQPAASPVHAMASRATTCALLFARIIPRTLPLMVARRKEPRHAL